MLAKTPSDKYCAATAAVLVFPHMGCTTPYPLSAPPTVSSSSSRSIWMEVPQRAVSEGAQLALQQLLSHVWDIVWRPSPLLKDTHPQVVISRNLNFFRFM